MALPPTPVSVLCTTIGSAATVILFGSHRREIAVLAQTDSHRKEANSQLRVTSTISGSVA
jgi:hypothetical protein